MSEAPKGEKHSSKSKQEAMLKNHAEWVNTEEYEARHTEQHQRCISAREEPLVCPAPEGVIKMLRMMH